MKDVFDCVVVHYGEIGLKGGNRSFFERKLIDNIKLKCGDLIKSCIRETGQITISIDEDVDVDKLKDVLSKVPGVSYFSFAKRCELDIEKIKECALELARGKEFSSFKVETFRHEKNFPLKSPEINALVGEVIFEGLGKKVDFKKPDIVLKVEITSRFAFVSCGDVAGVGGMPTNRKQRIVALLSGGFDSPVAAYLLMKRGCEVVLVHFMNQNQMSSSVQDKIVRIAEQLSKFQLHTKLYIVPFEAIQKEIIMKVRSDVRMLVYRKFMLRISSAVANLEKAKFLVVGDSLSQVASQTLENLEATYDGSLKPIFSPLIGWDKTEIIALSKRIGVYEISCLPYGDCCSFFLPKHPELKSSSGLLKKFEEEFDVDALVKGVLDKVKIVEF
jgi:thiamine biosynthesis protein ThiI